MNDTTGDCAFGRTAVQSGQFNILETVKGKTGLPDFFAPSAQDIDICGFGAAQIFGIEGAVGVQSFSVPQGNTCPGGTAYF